MLGGVAVASLTSELIDTGIASNTQDPCLEASFLIEAFKILEDPNEDVLGEVSRVVLVFKESIGDAVDVPRPSLDDPAPGTWITIRCCGEREGLVLMLHV